MGRLKVQVDWETIRKDYEFDHKATITSIAQKYGLDKSSVSRHSIQENWFKHGQLGIINDGAHRRADADYLEEETDIAYNESSEKVRAEVIKRHRQEWDELEKQRQDSLIRMREAYKLDDKAYWLVTKTIVECVHIAVKTLEIKQEGERKAWGLNVTPEEEIVIVNPRQEVKNADRHTLRGYVEDADT